VFIQRPSPSLAAGGAYQGGNGAGYAASVVRRYRKLRKVKPHNAACFVLCVVRFGRLCGYGDALNVGYGFYRNDAGCGFADVRRVYGDGCRSCAWIGTGGAQNLYPYPASLAVNFSVTNTRNPLLRGSLGLNLAHKSLKKFNHRPLQSRKSEYGMPCLQGLRFSLKFFSFFSFLLKQNPNSVPYKG
jgi:hypothetical protein